MRCVFYRVTDQPCPRIALRVRLLAGIALILAACVAACAPAATIRPTAAELARPTRTHVEVPLPGLTAGQAVDRIQAAFVAEGLAIASAAGGVVVSEPARMRSTRGVEVEKRYTGTVIMEERGPRVVLTGESRLAGRGEPWSVMGSHDPSWPARDGYHGFLKVRRIAARLTGDQPPESE